MSRHPTHAEELQDLVDLSEAIRAWGLNIKDKLPRMASTALLFNIACRRLLTERHTRYSALDRCDYNAVIKKITDGTESLELEDAITVVKKALHEANRNIRPIVLLTDKGTLRAAFTQNSANIERLKDIASAHALKDIHKLLKKSFA